MIVALRAWFAVALLTLAFPALPLPPAPPPQQIGNAAPSMAEVAFYTKPLIRARLRLPASLHAFAVTAIKPSARDPGRFLVEIRFRAKTPFGGITQHHARFHMKRAAVAGAWIVTAEQ